MIDPLIFSVDVEPGLISKALRSLSAHRGRLHVRRFPDEEAYVRVASDCRGRDVVLFFGMHQPDPKVPLLIFLIETLRELGARSVGAVFPYLPYMRQDKRFHDGEAVTSRIFAKLLSQHLDWLVTVDPHLHRYRVLSEIYSIPTLVASASPAIAAWIRRQVKKPVLVGPDEESAQWVSKIAAEAKAPFVVLRKKRKGDRKVVVSEEGLMAWRSHTPILIDDIISSGATMIETLGHLKRDGFRPAVCIGVHALFDEPARKNILKAGAKSLITCNTIPHATNAIDLSQVLTNAVMKITSPS